MHIKLTLVINHILADSAEEILLGMVQLLVFNP